jgi:hypothetical protein
MKLKKLEIYHSVLNTNDETHFFFLNVLPLHLEYRIEVKACVPFEVHIKYNIKQYKTETENMLYVVKMTFTFRCTYLEDISINKAFSSL